VGWQQGEGMAGPLLQVAQAMHQAAVAAADGVQSHCGTRSSGGQLQAVLVLSARCDAVVAAASCYNATPAGVALASRRSDPHGGLTFAEVLLTPATVMVCLGHVPWAPERPQHRLQALLQGAQGHALAAKPAAAASTPQKNPVRTGSAAAVAAGQPDMWAVPPTPDSMHIEDVVVADTPDADAYEGAGAGLAARTAICHPFEPLQPAGGQAPARQAAGTSSSSSSKACTCPSRAWTQPAVMELLLEGNPRHLQLLPRLLVDSGFQRTACSSCNTTPTVAWSAEQQPGHGMSVPVTAAAAAAAAVHAREGVVLMPVGAAGQSGEVRLQLLPRGRYLEVQLTAADHSSLLRLRGSLGEVLQLMQVRARCRVPSRGT
jgi:hypothetical protein